MNRATRTPQPDAARPPISVITPFRGSVGERDGMVERLRSLQTRAGDELIVVDNVDPGEAAARPTGPEDSPVQVITAARELSSYYARNAGAEHACNPWLLFIDGDCVPETGLLDAYFDPAPPEGCGVVAGGVVAASGQSSLVSRYARTRGHIDERWHVERKPLPAGVTANLLVLRSAWESLGGFHEGIRSGADVELCWRLQEAGWTFAHRPSARTEHLHPDRVAPMLRKTARHAAGRLWVNRRYPGAYDAPRPLRNVPRALGAAAVRACQGRGEEARFKLLDAAWHGADALGYALGDNRADHPAPPPAQPGGDRLLVLTDAAPARSETFIQGEVLALARLGPGVRVEASARPARTDRAFARSQRVDYMEDDPPLSKARDLAWLAARHPLRCLGDVRSRDGWRPEDDPWPLAALAPAARRIAASGETHIHVHFAAAAALHGLRIGRILDVPVSLALHGYDVYQHPANLPRKLERAAFSAAACASMRDDLVRISHPEAGSRIHVVPMGVDPEQFRRTTASPAGRRVVAIGRLVEKKGFAHLIEAAALLEERGAGVDLRIYGDGPLKGELNARIEDLGISESARVESLWGADAVRGALEDADLLAVPSVIARDGDRDSMPVVAKEALAMEVPVVASDVVGLPELIEERWGRLVPPGDASALAAAVDKLLSMPSDERRRMGVAGREAVLESFTVDREARRIAELIAAASRADPA